MISIQAEHLGQIITCPKCSQPMSVEAPASSAPPPKAKPIRKPSRPVAAPPTVPPAIHVPSAIPVLQHPPVQPTAPPAINRKSERPAPTDGESYKLQPFKDLPRRRAVFRPGHDEVNSSRGRTHSKRKSGGGLGWFAGSLLLLTLITVASLFFGPRLLELVRNSGEQPDAKQNEHGLPNDHPDRSLPSNPTRSSDRDMMATAVGNMIRPTIAMIAVTTNKGVKTGNGIFITEHGHILTNMNLVQHAVSIEVSINGISTSAVGFCIADAINDIAVIKIREGSLLVQPIAIAPSIPQQHERLLAFGHTTLAGSRGIKGNFVDERKIHELDFGKVARKGYPTHSNWLRSTVACTNAHFGGPLVDYRGRLVGMNTWATADMSYSVPLDLIKDIIRQSQSETVRQFSSLPGANMVEWNPVKEFSEAESIASRSNRNDGLPSFPADSLPNNAKSTRPTDAGNKNNDVANDREPDVQKQTDTTGAGFLDTTEAGRAFDDDEDPAVDKSFDTDGDAIAELAISSDNRFFAATSESGFVYVFDYVNLELLYKIDCDTKPIRKTSFSADPCYLCTASELGGLPSVHLRSPLTGESQKSIRKSGYGSPYSISISPDALSIFVSWGRAKRRDNIRLNDFMDMGIKFWKADSDDDKYDSKDPAPAYGGEIKRRVAINSEISPDGRVLTLGFDDGFVSMSDCTQDNLKLLGARDVHTKPVTKLAISNSGTSAVSASDDGQLIFSELEKRSLIKTELGDQKTQVLSVAYSPAGKYVAASRQGKKIEIFDVGSMSLAHTIGAPSECGVIKFVNADLIIAGCEDGIIRIFKLP